MSDSCCQNKCDDLASLAGKQSKVLWAVLWINLIMFFVEIAFGFISESTALIGDSLDMLGDALAYGTSIYVVRMGLREKILASKFKAYLMLILGLVVLGRAIFRIWSPVVPEFNVMTMIGLLALAANLVCLALLSRHKNDDINFRSVWVCSRNDIFANSSVLLASFFVFYFNSPWPDLAVGLGITVLFVRSAFGILKDARNAKLISNAG